ncbi:Uncharacterised protein [Chlamydia abortus]|nr:Uncharacterised protein [Chlamydia abortus]
MDVSHFPFVSDFVIFQVVKWMFLIFHGFQFSCHIPRPTVDISKFSTFSVFLAIFHVLNCIFLIFMIFSFLAIFQVLQCAFTFFTFFSDFVIFQVVKHFSFFTYFSDFVIFQVVKGMFLIFHDFQFSCHIPRPTVDISKFSTFPFSSPYFTS